MKDGTADHEQIEEAIITHDVSDEMLENAGSRRGTYSYGFVTNDTYCPGCC